MSRSIRNQLLLSSSFESFEELAAMAIQWDADFRQVSVPETGHRLLQVTMDGMLLSRARFGCCVQQYGHTPPGSRTMALLEENCSPVFWFGRRVGPGDLLVFPADGEINSVNRAGFNTHTFTVIMDDLAEFFEQSGGPELSKALGPEATVIPLSPVHLQRLRTHLRRVSFDQHDLQKSLVLYDAFREKLFALLLDVFRSRKVVNGPRGSLTGQHLIRDVFRLVERNRDEDLSLQALCAKTNAPERTLSGVFKRELGMSPASFVKGYRLFGVHRELWQAPASRARVTDIANSWGFWHMGQFAADYRKFFGELPSDTLKRSPAGS